MNKILKYTAILSGCLLTQHIINRTYLRCKNYKFKTPFHNKSKDYFYLWRFGRIHYKVIGKGDPLLLIHGIYPGADITQWENIDTEITKNHTVYFIDLLGFGVSEKPDITYSSYLYIRLINDFIRYVIKRPTITAASDYSAAYTVMGYIFDPVLYKKLLLIAPTGIDKGYKLPELKDYIFRHLIGIPIISTSAYIFLLHKIGRKYMDKLWCRQQILSSIPKKISTSAFAGGANGKLPISALLSKFLNVKIKDKLDKIEIPYLMAPEEFNRLQDISLSSEIVDFFQS